jgi:hypothetical protein
MQAGTPTFYTTLWYGGLNGNMTSTTNRSTSTPQPIPQQQPVIPSHEAVDSFRANGKINSDIITSTSKWTATGDWNMIVNGNELQLFETNMAWNNATSGHTHEFLGFEAEDEEIVLPPGNIVSITGNMDVATNAATSWEAVPVTIDIGGGGKVITISLDHEATDHHFCWTANKRSCYFTDTMV